ncbi:MAG: methionyl-tRNA formyltransferase [Panacagrimonas sp.]
MRLVFAGTPAFSVPALDALAAAGHDIVGIYTQPDRPSGRGQKLNASPVAIRALALGLPVFKPERLRGNEAAIAALRALHADCMVVVAYGLILPQAVLDVPRRGCLNIHASLLPRWRGAAPIQRAVLAGDGETGVTIMRMDAGLDTGPMLLRESLPIAPGTTAGSLQDQLAVLGARMIVAALERLDDPSFVAIDQPREGVTYASKLSKDEARLNFSLAAPELVRRIHGYNPMPGAWCELGGERIKLLRATSGPNEGATREPGEIAALGPAGLDIATGSGVLRVIELQRPGGRPAAPQIAFGGKAPPGARFH